MRKTKCYSWCLKQLPEGCKYCVEGRKTVLFITGICSKHCFYCPISDQKWQKDVIYANEWKVENFNQVCEEIDLCSSRGAGITGGDPLARLSRTCLYIRKLKKKFGRDFHIHLYTPLDLVDLKKLRKLHTAGLDEIRFNPDIGCGKEKLWEKISMALRFNWDIGVEIPSIPGFFNQTKQLIDYIHDKIHFLNINELEISDTNCNELIRRGFVPKDNISYGVKGSEEMALKLVSYVEKKRYDLKVHYCTTTLKDRVQLRNRIKLRAKNCATEFDKVTADGTLKRTVVYLDDLKPGFGYDKKIAGLSDAIKRKYVARLIKLNDNFDGILDFGRMRIIISSKMIQMAKKTEGVSVARIEEYPTQDSMLVSLEFVKKQEK